MSTCYLAHVTAMSEEIIGFQCVPTPSSFDGTVEYDRPGIRGWLTDEGWKVKCFEDFLTGDSTFPPECFTLAEGITDALDLAREQVRGHEGSLMKGHASIQIRLSDTPRATGKQARVLKEDEAERAIAGAYESNFKPKGTFIPGGKDA